MANVTRRPALVSSLVASTDGIEDGSTDGPLGLNSHPRVTPTSAPTMTTRTTKDRTMSLALDLNRSGAATPPSLQPASLVNPAPPPRSASMHGSRRRDPGAAR